MARVTQLGASSPGPPEPGASVWRLLIRPPRSPIWRQLGTLSREVPGPSGRDLPQEALPVHGHRRLHPPAGPADLSRPQPEDGHPVRGLRDAERLPFRVQVIQTDNGPEFGSAFHYHVLDKGVGHRYIKPRTPASVAHSVSEGGLGHLRHGRRYWTWPRNAQSAPPAGVSRSASQLTIDASSTSPAAMASIWPTASSTGTSNWRPFSSQNIVKQPHARRLLPSGSGWLRAIRTVRTAALSTKRRGKSPSRRSRPGARAGPSRADRRRPIGPRRRC